MGAVEHVVDTTQGRRLAVVEDGDPAGIPVLVHNGTPNSRLLYKHHVDDAVNRGLRLISYDRPGYGGSSPAPGRSVADCAADVRAICSALNIDRLLTWGVSGGGPHVLATAALLPDLVVAATSVASIAPYGVEGLDYFEGMGELNAEDARLYFRDKDAARAKVDTDREEMLSATREQVAAMLASLLSGPDAAVLSGDLAEYLEQSTHDGLAPGGEGWWEDGVAHLDDWGFDLDAISVPVLLLHGQQDQFVPFGHGVWLAAHIPGVKARLTAEDGHLTLSELRIPEVHEWLLSKWAG
ncbi:MAG TPA: alpha/beta fold hydrolase [Candidatus Dormibacteraeota bacterium]